MDPQATDTLPAFEKPNFDRVNQEFQPQAPSAPYSTDFGDQTPNYPGKTFGRKVGEDVGALFTGIGGLVGETIQDVAKTVPVLNGTIAPSTEGINDFWTNIVKPLAVDKNNNVLNGGIATSVKQIVDKKFYQEHPLLALVNDATFFTGAGSIIEKAGTSSAVRAGLEASIEEASTQASTAGLKSAVTAAKSSLIDDGVLKNATKEAIKTGDSSIITETAKNSLIKAGFDEASAASMAEKITGSVTEKLSAPYMKVAATMKAPFSAAWKQAGNVLKPIREAVVGAPADSAVGQLYPADIIKKDPLGFQSIESWASQQVTQQGLEDTINNRIKVMNDWAQQNGEWAKLSPVDRAIYQKNYVNASEMVQKVNGILGQGWVPGKYFSPEEVSAMKKTISNLPETESAQSIVQELYKVYGSDLTNFKETINKVIKENASNPKQALLEFADSLSSDNKVAQLTGNAEADAIIKKMKDETGYTPTLAPNGKTIVYAKPLSDSSFLTTLPDNFVAHKTGFGKMLENIGLSMKGTPEGTVEATYASQFTQKAVKELGVSSVKIGTTEVPVSRLYPYLNDIKSSLKSNALLGGRYTIADLTAGDLVKLGVDKDIASKIVSIARKSAILPVAQTGFAQTLVDAAKAYVPGYNQYLRMVGNIKYNSILSPFFALRVYGKMQVLKTLNEGFVSASLGDSATLSRITNVLRKSPILREGIAPEVTVAEQKLVADEILSKMPKETKDYLSNPDINLEQISTDKNIKFQNQTQSRMFWHNALGYNTVLDSASFAKDIAKKYGMTLEEALGYSVKDGNKIYNNPTMYARIADSIETTFHYSPGVMTSPMMRTLNVVMFPIRFETKVLQATAKFISNMPPAQRIILMTDLNHFAQYIQTPEGKKWQKENQSKIQSIVDYILPYQSIGHTLGSIADGNFSIGNSFQLGGIPLGFVSNILQDLALTPSSDKVNAVTGKKNKRSVPKTLLSKQSADVVFTDLVLHMMPSLPFYSISNGAITNANVQKMTKDIIDGGIFSQSEQGKRKLQQGFKSVGSSFTRY